MKLVLGMPEKKQSSANSCCQDEGQLLEYHGQEQEANRRKSILSFLWPSYLPLMPSLNKASQPASEGGIQFAGFY